MSPKTRPQIPHGEPSTIITTTAATTPPGDVQLNKNSTGSGRQPRIHDVPCTMAEPMGSATSWCEACFWKITVTPLFPHQRWQQQAWVPVLPLTQDIFTSWLYNLCLFSWVPISSSWMCSTALSPCSFPFFLLLAYPLCIAEFKDTPKHYVQQSQTGARKTFLKLELDSEFSLKLRKGTPFQTDLLVLTGHSWFEFWISWAFQHIFHHF